MACAWHVRGMCRACAGHVQGMCRACAGHVQGMYRAEAEAEAEAEVEAEAYLPVRLARVSREEELAHLDVVLELLHRVQLVLPAWAWRAHAMRVCTACAWCMQLVLPAREPAGGQRQEGRAPDQ